MYKDLFPFWLSVSITKPIENHLNIITISMRDWDKTSDALSILYSFNNYVNERIKKCFLTTSDSKLLCWSQDWHNYMRDSEFYIELAGTYNDENVTDYKKKFFSLEELAIFLSGLPNPPKRIKNFKDLYGE
jgi:hypothetical protein